MKLDLEVLASTNIKRNKPWPKILWIGEEHESLLLLDVKYHRVSVLYVPSGKTKKRIPKLSPLISDVVCVNSTKNGHYLTGLLRSGDIFIWHKDTDILKTIRGLSGVLHPDDLTHGKSYVFPSEDCSNILVVIGTSQIYIWERNEGENVLKSKVPEIQGDWQRITVPSDVDIPPGDNCKEFCVDTVYFSHHRLGRCCQTSIIYNGDEDICVATLLLRFHLPPDQYTYNLPAFHVEWIVIQYPYKYIHPRFQPITSCGAYKARYASGGQVLAVAANQNHPIATSMLYISPLTDTVSVSSMVGCGVRNPNSKKGRNYWIGDICWICDDLFLACCMKNGSVCVLTRLGEPLFIQTSGNVVEMGPANYLPLHPLLILGGDDNKVISPDGRPVSPSSVTSEANPQSQKFSVSSHPSLPIVLFSDGFMVTVLQVPVDLTSVSVMRDFVLSSTHHLKSLTKQENLDMSFVDAYKLPSGKDEKFSRSGLPPSGRKMKAFQFEQPDSQLNSTVDSESSLLDADMGIMGMNEGKLMFAECDSKYRNPSDMSGLNTQEITSRHLHLAEEHLFNAWKLAVSYPDLWMQDIDNIAKQILFNLTKLIDVILDCPGLENVLSKQKNLDTTAQNPRLFTVINTYRKALELLRFDIINKHLMSLSLRFVHRTLGLILNSKELHLTDPRIKTLSGCYALLKFTESMMNRVYTWIPKDITHTGLPPDAKHEQRQIYEPAILMKAQMSPRSLARAITSPDRRSDDIDQTDDMPSKRLGGSWKLLYKFLSQHQSHLFQSGDNPKEMDQLNSLIFAVQQIIRQLNQEVPKLTPTKLNQGDRLSLDGRHTMAVDAWKNQIRNLSEKTHDEQELSRSLHSVLYTYIIKGELGGAIDFVDSLVVQANLSSAVTDQLPQSERGVEKPSLMTIVTHTLKSQGSDEHQMVPCIKDKSIRQLVQSMARFMAAYFSNQTLFIYPPHNPQPLPAVHFSNNIQNNRIVPKYHEEITNLIRKNGLGGTWTTERTVEYLLLSGLVCESAWFADKMGDWKAAYLLSVACMSHRHVAPHLYKKKRKPLQLPDNNTPQSILQHKLQTLIYYGTKDQASPKTKDRKENFIPIDGKTDIGQLTRTVEDILTAGIMSEVEIVPWLLSSLVDQLKNVVSNFHPLVPQNFYLPAPPLYCPQPTDTSQENHEADVLLEKRLRHQTSSLIQLILAVLNAAHVSLPAARWYIQELSNIQEKAAQFKSTTEGPCLELPTVSQQYNMTKSILTSYQDETSTQQTLTSFRDFCSVLWLLHSRDKLSENLRHRESYLSNMNYQDYVRASWESKEGEKLMKECFNNLIWAVHMLAFSHFLPDVACIYKVVLSLLMELKPTEDTADILAEYFYDMENLDPEVQEKLDKLINDWQGVFIEPEDDGKSAKVEQEVEEEENDGRKSVTFFQASPRGKTLSVYFFKQCEVVNKVLKKRRKVYGKYEEFVFDSSERLNNGSLQSSLQPNNKFCIGSRSFETKVSYLEFLDNFLDISFSKLLDVESEQQRPSLPLLFSFNPEICTQEFEDLSKRGAGPPEMRKHSLIVMSSPRSPFVRSQSESHVTSNQRLQSQKGLFRSTSEVNDLGSSEEVELRKFKSEGGGLDETPEGSPHRSKSQRSKAKMTNLASKFSQSEDALYKDPTVDDDAHCTLDIDFGQKYQHMRQLLEWLYVWGRKLHSLGLHWKGEKDLDFKPTMKIDVPAQLVLLGLWLLENKYSPSKHRSKTSANVQQIEQKIKTLSIEEAEGSMHLSQEDAAIKRVKAAVEEHLQRSAREGHRKHQSRRKDMNMSASLRSKSSMHSTTEFDVETVEVHSAYEKVLNGNEDSSSLEVSSLGTDEYEGELKHTLTAIRGSGTRGSPDRSTLNHALHFQSSPDRGSGKPPLTSTPVGQRSKRMTSTEQFGAVLANQNHSSNQMMIGQDLAQQVQNIIRGELRRMMEAQHRSMMAMMNALDDPSQPSSGAPGRERVQSRGTSPVRMYEDGTRSTLIPNESQSPSSTKKRSQRSPERRENVRGVLTELRNLQDSTGRSNKKKRGPKSPSRTNQSEFFEKENASLPLQMSELRGTSQDGRSSYDENVDIYRVQHQGSQPVHIPRFLQLQAERDTDQVHFPHIPVQAWGQQQESQYQHEDIHMPLLQLDAMYGPSNIFPGMDRIPHGAFGPQFPQPPQYGMPPVDSQPRQQQSQGQFGMPLLSLSKASDNGMYQPTFGRLIDPGLIIGNEQEIHQKELLKQRLARDFHRQQVENLEELEKEQFGKNLLHINMKMQKLKEKDHQRRKKKQRENQTEKEKNKKSRKAFTQRKEQYVQKPKSSDGMEDRSVPVDGRTGEEILPEEVSTDITETDRGSDDIEEKTEEEEDNGEIHDGYAIKPGSFDNYLHMDKEFGSVEDTNARVQYKTAMILKKQQQQRRKKVDFSTMTNELVDADMETDVAMEKESVRTAEAVTSITKDTGVDPIQEAIVEYNRARQGNVLPPDIYLGLRFGDADSKPTSGVASDGQVQQRGRTYLNVVDMDASALLKDMHEKPEKEEKIQQDRGFLADSETVLSARQRGQGISSMEESLREALQPKLVKPFKQDALTVKMFETKLHGEDMTSVALMPRDSMRQSKVAVIQRLRDMNSQITAIDQMSRNIESDFHNTRLMLHTLEALGGVEEPLSKAEEEAAKEGLKKVSDEDVSQKLTPKKSQKSPKISARSTARSSRKTARSSDKAVSISTSYKEKSSQDLVHMSGLSGISDIIGEMVERGDIDLQEAGYTPREAERLAQKIKYSARANESMDSEFLKQSLEKLQQLAKDEPGKDNKEYKEQLHAWMNEQKRKRMEDYKKQREELREHERHPFKPSQPTYKTFTAKDLKDAEDEREVDRKIKGKENMHVRIRDAEALLGSILTDKPELPPDLPVRDISPKRKTSPHHDTSPKRRGKLEYQEISPKRQTFSVSPKFARKQYQYGTEPAREQTKQDLVEIPVVTSKKPGILKTSKEYSPTKAKDAPHVPKLRLIDSDEYKKTESTHVPRLRLIDSDEFMQRSVETTGEISDYKRAVEQMEVTGSQDYEISQQHRPPAEQKPPSKPYKQKSFTELVRLQRPHLTRKGPASKVPVPYVKRLASMSNITGDSAREISVEEKHKIYGSKRLPSSSRIPEPSPRQVKSYTERLQEMKSKKTYSTPIVPRTHVAGGSVRSSQESAFYRKKRGPAHKPLTYVERLQQLNEGTHKPKGTGKPTVTRQLTYSGKRKPPHRPKTYVQQLQDLQPPPKRTTQRMVRTRPYADPYKKDEAWEGDSVLSSWTMDDDVKRLLYEEEAESTMYGVGMSVEYPISENVSDYYDVVMADEYVDAVDVGDIARAASVSSGSIMSVIDWDAVDDLIADVH